MICTLSFYFLLGLTGLTFVHSSKYPYYSSEVSQNDHGSSSSEAVKPIIIPIIISSDPKAKNNVASLVINLRAMSNPQIRPEVEVFTTPRPFIWNKSHTPNLGRPVPPPRDRDSLRSPYFGAQAPPPLPESGDSVIPKNPRPTTPAPCPDGKVRRYHPQRGRMECISRGR